MRFRSRPILATMAAVAALGAGAGAVGDGVAHAATAAGKIGPRQVAYPTIEVAAARRRAVPAGGAPSALPLTYHGGIDNIGVTTGKPKVYLVFWGSQWGTASPAGSTSSAVLSNDRSGVAPRLQALFKGLGTNGEEWSGVMTQYCERVALGASSCPESAPHVAYPAGGALAGIWDDSSTATPQQPAVNQVGAEAVRAAAHFGNITASSNRNAQYMVVLATGVRPPGFWTQLCAQHAYSTSAYGDIAFTELPYLPDAGSSCGVNYVNGGAAGALDGVTIVAGHEYAETITDQNPVGGWLDASLPLNLENGDKCAWVGTSGTAGAQNVAFATGSFAMQATWSNDANACQILHSVVGPPPSLSASASPPLNDRAGTSDSNVYVNASGSGWTASGKVMINVWNQATNHTYYGFPTADAFGTFSLAIPVPKGELTYCGASCGYTATVMVRAWQYSPHGGVTQWQPVTLSLKPRSDALQTSATSTTRVVTAWGSGFAPGSTVQVNVWNQATNHTYYAFPTAGMTGGEFSVNVIVPASELTACGADVQVHAWQSSPNGFVTPWALVHLSGTRVCS